MIAVSLFIIPFVDGAKIIAMTHPFSSSLFALSSATYNTSTATYPNQPHARTFSSTQIRFLYRLLFAFVLFGLQCTHKYFAMAQTLGRLTLHLFSPIVLRSFLVAFTSYINPLSVFVFVLLSFGKVPIRYSRTVFFVLLQLPSST